tara:strand:+ start:370 stop:534 length:165 start_codon:yes stop_codon:yes gene_type:complete
VLIISLVSCSPSSVECYDIPSHYPLDSECCPDENDNYMCDNEEEDVELNISVVV